jgi:hypothetical protein
VSSLPLFHLRSIVIRDKEKQKGPIFVASWDPTGRRLLTGSESGYVVVIQGTPIKTWMVRREWRKEVAGGEVEGEDGGGRQHFEPASLPPQPPSAPPSILITGFP